MNELTNEDAKRTELSRTQFLTVFKCRTHITRHYCNSVIRKFCVFIFTIYVKKTPETKYQCC